MIKYFASEIHLDKVQIINKLKKVNKNRLDQTLSQEREKANNKNKFKISKYKRNFNLGMI